MTEFEKEMLTLMKGIDSRLTNVEKEISEMKSDIETIKEDIEEIKEEAQITRVATNYNGEKLEELTTELKNLKVIG